MKVSHFYGRLESCGIGFRKDLAGIGGVAEPMENCLDGNECLIKQLKNDRFEIELNNLTLEGAGWGGMSFPKLLSGNHRGAVGLHQRFGVAQGLEPNWDTKVKGGYHVLRFRRLAAIAHEAS